jgi:release factor glutamine methyltransferase
MNESRMKISIANAQAWARKHIHPNEARLLLRHVCDCCIAHLITQGTDLLMDDQWQLYQRLVARRASGEPIAYVTGRREFYGRKFLVNSSVLIPRPETELLVELALAYFSDIPQPRVLDLGTGSGVLAITLALELDRPDVTAVDSSRDALGVAVSNGLNMRIPNLALVWSDWYSGLNPADRFHLIVANPPYVAEGDPHLVQGDLRFEPPAALASGHNGLRDLAIIIAGAGRRLERGGRLFVEHGYDQAATVRSLLVDAGFAEIASWQDLAGIERVSGGKWMG